MTKYNNCLCKLHKSLTILTPRSDVTTYAIVTNVVQYSKTCKAALDSLSNGDFKKRKASVTGTGSSRKRSKGSSKCKREC